MKGWVNDLALGVRIALGGGRSSWRRLALTGVGVGLGVAVLLIGASAPNVLSERQTRQATSWVSPGGEPLPGVDPLYRVYAPEEFRGDEIMGSYVSPGGERAPVPPGLQRIPGDGEIAVSPALAALLDSPEGELLRPRFPQEVIGTITRDGLVGPNHLLFIAGDSTIPRNDRTAFYRFGLNPTVERGISSWYWALILVGSVMLLMPVLVFVTIGTRLAGPERERRLAALRLLGASSRQVRRIATGDALAGAVAGVVIGGLLFLVLRVFVERIEVYGLGVFRGDLTPDPVMAVLLVLLVPVLSVLTALVTLRGSVVDPLGVVRQGAPARRRLWWRFAPILVGVGLLVTQTEELLRRPGRLDSALVLAAVALLLLGIPLLLPWIVERSVGRLRGGPPSWQLAVRRLQMDSGSAARVVGGVAVVLAGGIAMQTVMAGQEVEVLERKIQDADRDTLLVYLSGPASKRTEELADLARSVDGVTSVKPVTWVNAEPADPARSFSVQVGSCEALRLAARIDSCRDGDAFEVVGTPAQPNRPVAGQRVTVHDDRDAAVDWTVPDLVEVEWLDGDKDYTAVLVTPAALGGLPVRFDSSSLEMKLDMAVPDVVDKARTALGPLGRFGTSRQSSPLDEVEASQYRTLRQLFLAGTLVVVLLAGASLLVMALEQVRTRRRPLAVLAAGGVPRSTLARSLLWQNAVPLVLAVVVAVVVGSGTGLLLQRTMISPPTLDLTGIGVLTAAVVVMVLLVTLCTMPAVRRATGTTGLRAE